MGQELQQWGKGIMQATGTQCLIAKCCYLHVTSFWRVLKHVLKTTYMYTI